jgi:hypothetical protein
LIRHGLENLPIIAQELNGVKIDDLDTRDAKVPGHRYVISSAAFSRAAVWAASRAAASAVAMTVLALSAASSADAAAA